jgi:phosphatidylinositol 4-kinase type 2
MFARQIAVMKGQAWNVVETLKQRDHGPLELTRRTRVCVWDDLVDIPIAIPLTRPSADLSRRRNMTLPEQEEIDIGASRRSGSISEPVQDLLALGSPTSELPNPNRFQLTRDEDAADPGRIGEELAGSAPVALNDFAESEARQAKQNLSSSVQLPPRPSAKGKTRFSFDFSRPSPTRRTRHSKSFSTRRGSNARLYEGDDLEGDLGYAAAGNMEGSQKKVIVERLEAVKSKNPVFTWC